MARREVRLVQTTRPFEYRSPFPNQEHTLLVCVHDDSITVDERRALSREIVAARCRYAVCWGHECSAWDTAIDLAYIETDENFDPPDETLVMTTWHEDEPIEDTIEFWWMNTCFNDYESERFAVLIVGDDPEMMSKIRSIANEMAKHWNEQQHTISSEG